MRAAVAFCLCLAMASCGAAPARAPDENTLLRNPTAPMGGTSRFDAARFAGDWKTVACLGRCAQAERFATAPDGAYLRGEQPYDINAPGVLRQQGGDALLVVMWVDTGFRTAVIGDADGRWASIIDRGAPSADRTAAAIEILDFNGWDVSRLQRTAI